MTINLQNEHLQAIRTHAERVYPNECCGLLLGCLGETQKECVEVWETQNAWEADAPETREFDRTVENPLTQERRYTIAPEEMLAAQRYCRDRDLTLIGIYHSHPNHPAIPSECDRQLAWPEYSYIIVSVTGGSSGDLRSWQLDGDGQFQSEEIRCDGYSHGHINDYLTKH